MMRLLCELLARNVSIKSSRDFTTGAVAAKRGCDYYLIRAFPRTRVRACASGPSDRKTR